MPCIAKWSARSPSTEATLFRIVIDAIDQLPEDTLASVRAALSVLADLGTRIVVTARPGTCLPERAEQLHIQRCRRRRSRRPPGRPGHRPGLGARNCNAGPRQLAGRVTARRSRVRPGFDIAEFSASWGAIYEGVLSSVGADESVIWEYQYRPVLTVLAAAGTGPVLPVPLLRLASEKLGGPPRIGNVRDTLVGLRQLVVRGHPGTQDEQVGLFHATLHDYLSAGRARYTVDVRQGHGAIHDAIDELAPMARHDPADPLHRYAAQMEPEHLWAIGDYSGVTLSLKTRASVIPAENLRRWRSWEERLAAQVGETHPDTITARFQLIKWTGQSGDAREALRLSRELQLDLERVLGPDHPDTFANRANIAAWTGAAGDARAALRLFRELLPDQARVLGPDNHATLANRAGIAAWTGPSGDFSAALRLNRELLPDLERVLGPDHPDTLATRGNIAFWTGQSLDSSAALRLYRELLPDLERVLGPDHPETLRTRSAIAAWTGPSGDPREALRLDRELLLDRERVLGPDHPDTLMTRADIAAWTGAAGDASARAPAVPGAAARPGAGAGPGPSRDPQNPRQHRSLDRRGRGCQRRAPAVPGAAARPRAGAGPGPSRHPQNAGNNRSAARPGGGAGPGPSRHPRQPPQHRRLDLAERGCPRSAPAVPGAAALPEAGAGPGPSRHPRTPALQSLPQQGRAGMPAERSGWTGSCCPTRSGC